MGRLHPHPTHIRLLSVAFPGPQARVRRLNGHRSPGHQVAQVVPAEAEVPPQTWCWMAPALHWRHSQARLMPVIARRRPRRCGAGTRLSTEISAFRVMTRPSVEPASAEPFAGCVGGSGRCSCPAFALVVRRNAEDPDLGLSGLGGLGGLGRQAASSAMASTATWPRSRPPRHANSN